MLEILNTHCHEVRLEPVHVRGLFDRVQGDCFTDRFGVQVTMERLRFALIVVEQSLHLREKLHRNVRTERSLFVGTTQRSIKLSEHLCLLVCLE